MTGTRERLFSVWRRAIALSWPVAVAQAVNTLMRTTDVVIAGQFSPAAVAAVGLADLYAHVNLRLGMGFGAGAIALSSQDTGRSAGASRDEAVSQAMLMGFLAGLPVVAFGLTLAVPAIAILGATAEVARLGGAYLAIVLAVAPARIVGLVGARSLQGIGDTTTPMLVNVSANVLNIAGSVVLGLGIGPAPRLGIVGIGAATAGARMLQAGLYLLVLYSDRSPVSLTVPSNPTIARQLLAVSLPNIAEGLSTMVVRFPFNAILLGFGTEVNAAYHVGRRMYQQVTGPLYRAFATTSSIVVGQHLGEDDPDAARFSGYAITGLAVLTVGLGGAALFLGAGTFVRLFTGDPATIGYAADFARVFGASMVFFGVAFPLSGALRAAGDTRTPFLARASGSVGFTLGFSYLVGVVLGVGLPAVYLGIALTYAWFAAVVGVTFHRGAWADRAAAMMAERAATVD